MNTSALQATQVDDRLPIPKSDDEVLARLSHLEAVYAADRGANFEWPEQQHEALMLYALGEIGLGEIKKLCIQQSCGHQEPTGIDR